MSIRAGIRLGPYEILAPIGAGAMGEVYSARDTKLGREVAIKVLPEAFSQDRERLARFEREARLLASLNHPNIATIYDLEEWDDVHFLVLELVPGETLAERIKRGPVTVDEALPIFRQIAEALEAAHEKGVIHRDLKPANIKVTPEGKVKVLDFGLAKALGTELSSGEPTESPTITREGTETGVILGTAAYMSPEQARGKRLDKRTDIWAFGCVLYEALTRRVAFRGDTISDTIAQILEREPDWEPLPERTPMLIRSQLRRCLQKDPRRRLHDIADARIEIEEALNEPQGVAAPVAASPRKVLGWSAASLFVGALVAGAAFWGSRPALDPPAVARLQIALPPSAPLALGERPPLAISPDGRSLVYVGTNSDATRLYRRGLGELEAKPIPDTEGATGPFFSPDGQWVGFFAGFEMRKVSLSGGASQLVSGSPPVTRGASWTAGGDIIITPTNSNGLFRISTSDDTYEMVTSPDVGNEEKNHSWPQVFPGAKAALVSIQGVGSESFDDATVAAIDLATGERKILIEGGYHARYVPTGHLVFMSSGKLMVAPFALSRLEVTGAPTTVLEDVMTNSRTGAAYFSFSDRGTLVYVPGGTVSTGGYRLVWVDRTGVTEPLTEERQAYSWPRLAPGGERLAVTIEGASDDLWIYELARGSFTRFTFEGRNIAPVWTPDGRRLTFSTQRGMHLEIVSKRADGRGGAEVLVSLGVPGFSASWTPDGKVLAFMAASSRLNTDVLTISLDGDGKPERFLSSRFFEMSPTFSPDGRWLAYTSDESGRSEVYVLPYPGPGGKISISIDGGEEAIWSPNGQEIFYRSGDKMMTVSVTMEPELRAGRPRVLFERKYVRSSVPGLVNYDVSPGGDRFVMIEPAEPEESPTQLNVVLNWFEELKRLAN